MDSGKEKPNIWYENKNVKSFIFPTKNVERFEDSLYHEIVWLGLHISTSFMCLIEIVMIKNLYLNSQIPPLHSKNTGYAPEIRSIFKWNNKTPCCIRTVFNNNAKIRVKFEGSYLKQYEIVNLQMVNLCIVYELNLI